ncbi:MAG TPA: PhoH family protein, partial [Rhodocyclaceae bacterium]|nr:PhoH family protein [Rhodocyclaceae bacterium]
ANLCGPLDENIRQIATAFDVVIARRGERFTVKGEGAGRVVDALKHFYALARDPLTVDDVQLGLIELTNAPVRRLGANEGVTDGPQLVTRKTELHGRTPRQVEYLKAIQGHDITFGIGPAGTGKT